MTIDKEIVAALFAGIDLNGAHAVLKKLGLPVAYSDEAVATINARANELAGEAAALKRADAPRAERKAVREQVDRLVTARAVLYRLRPAQPGDVIATATPMGGK